ncbi:TPA_asm: hypothetical protein vir556_00001 [dsDNA virus vir556]|nr:TPA_asm: hypothetical protein vir556_00001 [dsDNA virus vir556]
MLSEEEVLQIRDSVRFLANLGFGDFTQELKVLDLVLESEER